MAATDSSSEPSQPRRRVKPGVPAVGRMRGSGGSASRSLPEGKDRPVAASDHELVLPL
jgi:hypothetical protein